MRILYTLTLFLSSALLFLIQPMVAKIILPAFGGSPAVWTTSMVFFQAVLLAGYAYAHFSIKKLGPRLQAAIHLPLMILALATLPFAAKVAGGATGARSPLFAVIAVLLSMVGAVFFVVSAGAPVLQRWFAATGDKDAKDPYFLYSASNLGSMLALLVYPALIEPRFRLTDQTRLWTWGYVALVVLMALAAFVVFTKSKTPQAEEAPEPAAPITNKQRGMWILLGAVPSSLLLGVTAYLTSNVAPVPLLWVVPLALYLLTFIFAFARKTPVKSGALARLLPLILTPLALAVILESTSPLVPLAIFHLSGFFVAAWMCHARLSESRPDASHLTEFYLCMSIGGVLGGLFNAAIAPLIFTTLLEYPLALVVACFLRPPRTEKDGAFTRMDAIYPVVIGLLTIGITIGVRLGNIAPSAWRTLFAIGVPAILCFFAVDRPRRYALSLGALFAAAFAMHTSSEGVILYTARSFFGVHRVLAYGNPVNSYHALTHGTTKHGMQDTARPLVPLTYYTHSGPIGQVLSVFHGPTKKKNIAFVGLGVGSLAAYGEPGQRMTFFEIDPVVREIATNPKFFTYLRDSKADVHIVMGDARLSMAQQPDSSFGLIVLDAFSSDAIPVHLLTEEAIKLDLSKLEPRGVLAIHISNHYLRLGPVLGAIAKDLGLYALIDDDYGVPQEELELGKNNSEWVVMAREKADLGKLNKDVSWDKLEVPPGTKAWTDDFSNLLSAFKFSD